MDSPYTAGVLGAAFIVVGTGLAGWGLWAALVAPRPRSLGGALIGAAGLGLAMAGAVALRVPGFLW